MKKIFLLIVILFGKNCFGMELSKPTNNSAHIEKKQDSNLNERHLRLQLKACLSDVNKLQEKEQRVEKLQTAFVYARQILSINPKDTELEDKLQTWVNKAHCLKQGEKWTKNKRYDFKTLDVNLRSELAKLFHGLANNIIYPEINPDSYLSFKQTHLALQTNSNSENTLNENLKTKENEKDYYDRQVVELLKKKQKLEDSAESALKEMLQIQSKLAIIGISNQFLTAARETCKTKFEEQKNAIDSDINQLQQNIKTLQERLVSVKKQSNASALIYSISEDVKAKQDRLEELKKMQTQYALEFDKMKTKLEKEKNSGWNLTQYLPASLTSWLSTAPSAAPQEQTKQEPTKEEQIKQEQAKS